MKTEELNAAQLAAVHCEALNLLVVAGPGSGKTRTLAASIVYEIAQGTEPDKIVAITYTNDAARELAERIGGRIGFIGTIHAYLLTLIRQHGPEMFGMPDRLAVIDEEQTEAMLAQLIDDLGLKKITKKAAKESIDSGPIQQAKEFKSGLELLNAQFYGNLNRAGLLTYQSILFSGIRIAKRLASRQGPESLGQVLFVDEYQDASDLVHEACLALPFRKRRFFGDPDQCQPAGTMVRMADGSLTPIEKLMPGDEVVSYARREKSFIKKAQVTAVSRRPYEGLLYSVSANGMRSESTDSHKWLIKWLSGAERTRNKWCVYMMRKGDRFRIGKTCLFRSGSGKGDVLGLPLRMRQEGADAGWILSVHETAGEALAREDITAATYGIPQTCFRSNSKGGLGYSQDVIDSIFSAVPEQMARAIKCLEGHGRSFGCPLFYEGQVRTRRTVQEIHACNLLDDVMKIPTCEGPYSYQTHAGNWHPIKVSARQFKGEVFSLDVAKHHKYVADGLVTCNSIYGFAGGNIAGINSLVRSGWCLLLLEDSYRCAAPIAEAANQLIARNPRVYPKQIRAQSGNIGELTVLPSFSTDDAEFHALAMELKRLPADLTGAVLVRSNFLVEKVSEVLKTHGVEVRKRESELRPPDWNLALQIVALMANPENDFLCGWFLSLSMGEAYASKIRREAAAAAQSLNRYHLRIPRDVSASNVPDLMARASVSLESIEIVREVLAGIHDKNATAADLTLALAQRRWIKEDGKGVVVSTIHSAKGREWDWVFVPACDDGILPNRSKSSDYNEERRLLFVAITRARSRCLLSTAGMRISNQWERFKSKTTPSPFLREVQPPCE